MTDLLPTRVVTLLLADIEGSTRLWDTQPDEMGAAVDFLDRTLARVVVEHDGVRPLEQGEGDSFVIAFARASDAVACALSLQRAPLPLIRMRMGVHTGEVRLRGDSNYIGPTINEAARLRDLAHGRQTVLSAATEEMVADRLPIGAWLTDLGVHEVRGVTQSLRVVQLCHPDLCNEFPPLRTANTLGAHNFPVSLTSFVGRGEQVKEVRERLADSRLVTLTGAGGAGKTRLAVQVAAAVADEYPSGAWFVDLSSITDSDDVLGTIARALGLLDQPGGSTVETLARFVGHRRMLLVLDNCEHLLDMSADVAAALLGVCPGLMVLATSRQPLAVAGEVTWRIPSLAIADEAIELFVDRARRVRSDFILAEDTASVVTEICRRLDGMPLAIELAAVRVRTLSLRELADSLRDRFDLLTGGGRAVMPRQQTLRASVDWSHELLTDVERLLFRRLSVFRGGFDLDAVHAVASDRNAERYRVLDQITQLVDKSLVVAESAAEHTRFRLLETMRQYAAEKLSESAEAVEIRARHFDYYMAMVDALHSAARAGREQLLERTVADVDNIRAAVAWTAEQNHDPDLLIRAAQGAVWLADMPLADRLAEAAIREGAGADAKFIRVHALSWLSRGAEADAVLAQMSTTELTDDEHARWVILRASNRLWALADPDGARAFIDEVARTTPPHIRSCIDAFLTVYWFAMGKPEASAQSARNVSPDGLPTVVGAEVAWAITAAAADAGRVTDALVAAEAGYGLASRCLDAPQMALIIADAHVGALLSCGRVEAATHRAERLREQNADLPGVAQLLSAAVAGRAALGAGQIRNASSLLGEVAEALADAGESNGWAYRYQVPRTIALALLGQTSEATAALQALEKLRHASWRFLDYERALAQSWVAAATGAVRDAISITRAAAETAHGNGQFGAEVCCLQTATQFGDRSTAQPLCALESVVEGERVVLAARFATAMQAQDAGELATTCEDFARIGDLVAALDASAHAALAYHRDDLTAGACRCARRAESLAELCGGVTTPALRQLAEL